MAQFSYQALDASGARQSGIMEALSEREARERLRAQNLMLTAIKQKSSFSRRERLQGEALTAFTMQLAQLVSAGMPLYESLMALEEQGRNDAHHRILLSLCDQVRAGAKLSEVMASFPDSFDALYCSMVSAGESVGALGSVLDKLSRLLEKQMKLQRDITTAMIYPAVLMGFSFLVIGLLLGFVIPSIEGIFAGRTLNAFTETVIALSHFFQNWWWAAVPSFLGMVALIVVRLKSPSGQRFLEKVLLKTPLINSLTIQAAVARFARTMATLQQGGLPMIDSLRIARKTMRNYVLEEELSRGELKIVEGSSLGVELGKSVWLPQLVARMVMVGEESGSLAAMLTAIADMYENSMEKTLQRVTALAQPVILIIMGVIIGSVLMAVLLPLTDVSSLSL